MGTRQKGFTIVELLIVIVVIAILAAITIIAYNGIQKRANDAAIQSDLKNIATALSNYNALKGTYPTSETQISNMNNTALTGVAEANAKVSRDSYDLTTAAAPGDQNARNLLICVRSGGTSPAFGIAAFSKSGDVWFYTSGGGLTKSPDSWIGQQTTSCPRLGIALSDPGYARWFGYERPLSTTDIASGWKSWAAN